VKELALTPAAEAITAVNVLFADAFARGDAAAIARLYTEDAAVLPPNLPVQRGRAAIRAFWQGAIDMGLKAATLTWLEVEDLGDEAIEVGSYELFLAGSVLLDEGKYIVVWKREGGAWRMHRDIWNTSQRAG
jgi:uncharacterized protein (TIGR02246 family)